MSEITSRTDDSANDARAAQSAHTLSRRDFIKVASVAGGGLVLALHLPLRDELLAATAGTTAANGTEAGAGAAADAAFVPNAWLRIATDGTVTVTVAKSEMGQGVRTALPMIVAEELEADWSQLRAEPATVAGTGSGETYGNMTTGGSSSVRGSWERLRQAGAVAREMLVSAAAQTWGVDRRACRAENGTVVHAASGRRLTYGQLAETAAKQAVPEHVPLKDPKQFRIVGQRLPRLDTPSKVNGSAQYGFDVKVPGMLIAMVERCPVIGGKLKSFDASLAQKVAGVSAVVEVESGVAVVADSTWAAMKGRDALSVVWDEGPNAALDSAAISRLLQEKSRETGVVARHEGDAAAALARAAKRVEAVYEVPFLAHAPMEPQNCLAYVRDDGVEIWAPTQVPQRVQGAVAQALGIALEKVTVHITLLGGGFGRRLMADYAVEAARVSKAAGAPVKVVWTREDDMRHDFYRPTSLHKLAAGIDGGGKVIAWTHRVVGPSIERQVSGGGDPQSPPDLVDGAVELAYDIPNVLVEGVVAQTPVPLGWWRSVYNSQNGFANEAFLDEVAAATGADPCELRRKLLPKDSRLRRALELAAQKAGWGSPLPKGRGRGIASHGSFGSFVAHVIEASVDDRGRVRVHKVVCAVDCGPVVNPDIVEAQLQGAVAFGLSAALKGEITVQKGRVEQGSFDGYELLTFDEMPQVEVHIVPSNDAIGGIGEPGVPPVAPALCSAIFAATGKRVRRLPVRLA